MMSSTAKRLMISLFIAALMGCATNAPKTPDYFATDHQSQALNINRVALTSDLIPPKIESVDLGFTREQGAAGGAAGGALEGTRALLGDIGGCSGDFCGAVFLLLLPVFVVGGAIIGAVSGTDSGYSADVLAEAEAKAQHMLNSAYLQTELLDHVQRYGHDNVDLEFIRVPSTVPNPQTDTLDHKAFSRESTDAALEVELLELTLEHSLEMEARARMTSTRTGAVLSDSRYRFSSEHRRLEEWIADGSAALTEAIRRGLKTLAEDIIDENFLLFYPTEPKQASSPQEDGTSDQVQRSENKQVPHYVLSPIYPALDSCFLCERPFSTRPHSSIGSLEFVEVASVQPTLQWERFPREHDVGGSDGSHHQITDVRYELRIFDTAIPASTNILLVPAQQVYEARGIPEPLLTVNSGLNACSDYFWTVRARFKLDGRIRVTEWAGAFEVGGWNEKPWNLRRGQLSYQSPPSWLIGVNPPVPDGPEWFYYPFRTPCDSGKTLAPKH